MASYPEGRFACVLCGHDVAEHNSVVGCPACTCMASPGEAQYNVFVKEPYEGRILARTETRSRYVTRPEYGKSVYRALREEQEKIEDPQCPLCRGSGKVAVGPWGRNPSRVTCGLCQGKRKLARTVAEAFRVGVEMGRSSAYLGHYDQYDTGSLMFSAVESPYEPDVTLPAEVNGRKRGF